MFNILQLDYQLHGLKIYEHLWEFQGKVLLKWWKPQIGVIKNLVLFRVIMKENVKHELINKHNYLAHLFFWNFSTQHIYSSLLIGLKYDNCHLSYCNNTLPDRCKNFIKFLTIIN